MTEADPRPTGAISDPEERARDEFAAMVDQALASVPEPFASQLDGVAIVIEDDPAPGQAPPGQLLFGLYQGVPKIVWGSSGAPFASKITIFRRPHEMVYPDPVTRARAVEGTVLHEIAHYLGTDETRIRAIEAARKSRQPGG